MASLGTFGFGLIPSISFSYFKNYIVRETFYIYIFVCVSLGQPAWVWAEEVHVNIFLGPGACTGGGSLGLGLKGPCNFFLGGLGGAMAPSPCLCH